MGLSVVSLEALLESSLEVSLGASPEAFLVFVGSFPGNLPHHAGNFQEFLETVAFPEFH